MTTENIDIVMGFIKRNKSSFDDYLGSIQEDRAAEDIINQLCAEYLENKIHADLRLRMLTLERHHA